MGKIHNALIKLRIKVEQWQRRRKLRYTDFSIISNNCWAGTAVYQPFGLKYNTPTVGLFIMDEDYIRFLENLDWYLTQEPRIIEARESKYYDKITAHGTREITYPIALIGSDVEIHFMHYHTPEEAIEKWNRRRQRINRRHLIVKMSIRDTGYDINDMINRFSSLPFNNKICFTPIVPQTSGRDIVEVPELKRLNLVGGDETEVTLRHINVYELLNSVK